MSTPAERAAARRAKILARGASRMAVVNGEASCDILKADENATFSSPTASPVKDEISSPNKKTEVKISPTQKSKTKDESDIKPESPSKSTNKVSETNDTKIGEVTDNSSGSKVKKEELVTADVDVTQDESGKHEEKKVETSNEEGSVDAAPAADPKKLRPLAMRRSKIEAAALLAAKEESKKTLDETLSPPDPDDDSIASFKSNANSVTKAKTVDETPKRKMTVKEIEEEIIKNTAAFDAKVIKVDVKKDEKTEEKDGNKKQLEKSEDGNRPVKPIVKAKRSMNITEVMKIVRVVLLIIFGIGTGYRTVISKDYKLATVASIRYKHLQQASLNTWKGYDGPTSVPDEYSDEGGGREISAEEELVEWMRFIEEDEREQMMAAISGKSDRISEINDVFDSNHINSINDLTYGSQTAGRTWFEWLKLKIYNYLDSSSSAVGVVWWTSSLITPFIDITFGISKLSGTSENKFNIMDFVMNIRSRIKNWIFSFVGEITVHMLAVVTTILVYQSVYVPSTAFVEQMNTIGNSAVSSEL